jgi:beta-lactamase regulating signal transducer with metallopeptidase domain
MIAAWMANAALLAVGLSAIALGVERIVAGRLPVTRIVWLLAMLASALAPVILFIARDPRVQWVDASPVVTMSAAANGQSASAVPRVDVDVVVMSMWAGASIAIAAWLFAIHVGLRRRIRSWKRATLEGNQIVVSPDFGPAVVGVFRSEIVLPQWALALSADDQRLVIAHEQEHTRAHDPLAHLTGLALAVLVPWNLVLWWQFRRLRLAIEIDCDARVVRHHVRDRVRYGELLLAAHSNGVRHGAGVLSLGHPRSALGRRVEALLSNRRSAVRRSLGVGAAFALGGASLAFVSPPTRTIVLTREPVSVAGPQTQVSVIASEGERIDSIARAPVPRATRNRRSMPVLSTTLPPLHVTRAESFDVTSGVKAAPLPVPSRRPGGVVRAAVPSARNVSDTTGAPNASVSGVARATLRRSNDTSSTRPNAPVVRPLMRDSLGRPIPPQNP